MGNGRTTIVSFADNSYILDESGFLDPPEQWDERFAEGMAVASGIERGLTEEHWSFIRYLRQKHGIERTLPVVVFACMDNGLTLGAFRRLFPTGYLRGACKIAGIDYDFICAANRIVTYETNWSSYDGLPTTLQRYKLTPMGFLESFADWDEDFAEAIARELKLAEGLTAPRRAVISFLREFYETHDRVPTIAETCRPNDMNLRDFAEMFPAGYRRGACRIAGLPYV